MSRQAELATRLQAHAAASFQQQGPDMQPSTCTIPSSKSAKLLTAAACAPPEYDDDDGDYTDSEFGSQPGSRTNSRPQSPAQQRPYPSQHPLDRIRRAKGRRHSSHAGDRPTSGRSREFLANFVGLSPEATKYFMQLPRTSQSGASTPPLSRRNSGMPGQDGPGSRDISRNPSCTGSRNPSCIASRNPSCNMENTDADNNVSGIRRNIAAARAFATGKSQGSNTNSPQGSFVHTPGSGRTSYSQDEGVRFCLSSSFVNPQASGSSQGAMRPVSPAMPATEEQRGSAPELDSKPAGGVGVGSGRFNKTAGEAQLVRSNGNVHSPLMQVAGMLASRGQVPTAQSPTLMPRPPTRPPSRKDILSGASGIDSPGSGCASPVHYRRMHTDTSVTVPSPTTSIGAGTVPQSQALHSGGNSPASNNSPSTSLSGQPTHNDMNKPTTRRALRPTSAMNSGRSLNSSGWLSPSAVTAVGTAPPSPPPPGQRFATPRVQRLQTAQMQAVLPAGVTMCDMQRACYSDSGVAQWAPRPPIGHANEVPSSSAAAAGTGPSRTGSGATNNPQQQQQQPQPRPRTAGSQHPVVVRFDDQASFDVGGMLHADLMDSLHDDLEFENPGEQRPSRVGRVATPSSTSCISSSTASTAVGTWATARPRAAPQTAAAGAGSQSVDIGMSQQGQRALGTCMTDPPTDEDINSPGRPDAAQRRLFPQPGVAAKSSQESPTPGRQQLLLSSPKVVPPPLAEIDRPSSRSSRPGIVSLAAQDPAQSSPWAGAEQHVQHQPALVSERSNPGMPVPERRTPRTSLGGAEHSISHAFPAPKAERSHSRLPTPERRTPRASMAGMEHSVLHAHHALGPERSSSRLPTPERVTPPSRTSLIGNENSAPRMFATGTEQRSAQRASLTGIERNAHRVSLTGADKGVRRVSQIGGDYGAGRKSVTGTDMGFRRTSQTGTEMTPHLAAAIALCTTPAQPILAGQLVVGSSPASQAELAVPSAQPVTRARRGTRQAAGGRQQGAQGVLGNEDGIDSQDSLAVPPCRLS